MAMRKRIFTQSLAAPAPKKASEELKKLPTGAKVKAVYDTVTSWVSDLEDIEAKAEGAGRRRENAWKDAIEDREEEVVDILMTADEKHKKKEEKFWEDVTNAQHDFEVRMETEGIVARDKKLKEDIENQFEKWGNMKRVGSTYSLAAKKEASTMKSLKALESDIDSILATL